MQLPKCVVYVASSERHLILGKRVQCGVHHAVFISVILPLLAGHCDSPDPIVNGHISGDGSSYRDTVVYQCMLGYRLIGTSVRICQQDHRWSGTTPVCVLIQCGPPPQVHYGKVEGTDHSWGSSVTYSCFHGYQLSTPAVLSCEGNGTWTGDIPQCLRKLTPHCILCSLQHTYHGDSLILEDQTFCIFVKSDYW
uniref:Sushi domain-containing protein n=1 Tax=Stegastes partitus TaxID=144197 RepID=A0A3B5AXB4_9TELE